MAFDHHKKQHESSTNDSAPTYQERDLSKFSVFTLLFTSRTKIFFETL